MPIILHFVGFFEPRVVGAPSQIFSQVSYCAFICKNAILVIGENWSTHQRAFLGGFGVVLTAVSGIREHLRITESAKAYRAAAFSRASPPSAERSDDYSCAFKELFCIAASDLATTVQMPLEKLGILFEEIMSTGTVKRNNTLRSLLLGSRAGDYENGQAERAYPPLLLGRGQLLFAVRQATRYDSIHLQAVGYCFTNPTNVIDSLARSMQVPHNEIASRIKLLQAYANRENILEPGIHLACFALRPLLQRGFDVLVRRNARNLLPTISLPVTKLMPWQLDILAQMNTWTVTSCCERLRGRSLFANLEEQHFVRQLFEGIAALADEVGSTFFEDARLIARPFKAPCRSDNNNNAGNAFIIAFRIITDVHEFSVINQRYEFTPLRFYLAQQHTYKNSPDIDVFDRKIRREFAAISDSVRNNQMEKSKSPHPKFSLVHGSRRLKTRRSSAQPHSQRWSHMRTLSCGGLSIDNNSAKNLVRVSTCQPSGSLHVSNEVSIDIRRESFSPEAFELRSLGIYGGAGVSDAEDESFAEKLVALTIDERRRQR